MLSSLSVCGLHLAKSDQMGLNVCARYEQGSQSRRTRNSWLRCSLPIDHVPFKRLTISATNARLQQAYGRGAVARGEPDNIISEARERLKTDKYKAPLDI